jgi:hypothetical protein
MGLISRVFLIAVVVVLVVAVARYSMQASLQPVTRAQAVANITNYIHDAYGSNAVVNITNVTPSQYQGSWNILAGVITNGTSPCPSYFVLSFEYPFNTYNSRTQNNYTSNCKVNEATMGSYPVAIAKSYSLNISQVRDFVNQYGYSNVVVQANKESSQLINGINYTNVWVVRYSAPATANSSVWVYLETNGTLITAT